LQVAAGLRHSCGCCHCCHCCHCRCAAAVLQIASPTAADTCLAMYAAVVPTAAAAIAASIAGVLIRLGWQRRNHCWCPGAAVLEMVMLPLSLLSCTCLAMSVAVAATATMLLLHSQCTSPEVRAAATAAVDPWFAPLSLAGRRWAVPQRPLSLLLPPPLPLAAVVLLLALLLCWHCCCAGTAAARNCCATAVALGRCNPTSLNPAAADTCWGTTAVALDDWSRHCRCRSTATDSTCCTTHLQVATAATVAIAATAAVLLLS
jgi:hypothetical protein